MGTSEVGYSDVVSGGGAEVSYPDVVSGGAEVSYSDVLVGGAEVSYSDVLVGGAEVSYPPSVVDVVVGGTVVSYGVDEGASVDEVVVGLGPSPTAAQNSS